jgi:hypothetical protein
LEPIPSEPLSAGIAFPDRDALSAKMNRVAVETGLMVSDDSVVLMQRALEYHLKNIIEKMIAIKVSETSDELRDIRRNGPQIGSFLNGNSPLQVPNAVHRFDFIFKCLTFVVMCTI